MSKATKEEAEEKAPTKAGESNLDIFARFGWAGGSRTLSPGQPGRIGGNCYACGRIIKTQDTEYHQVLTKGTFRVGHQICGGVRRMVDYDDEDVRRGKGYNKW